MKKLQIGKFHVKEPMEVTDQGENIDDFWTLLVRPGDYTIYVLNQGNGTQKSPFFYTGPFPREESKALKNSLVAANNMAYIDFSGMLIKAGQKWKHCIDTYQHISESRHLCEIAADIAQNGTESPYQLLKHLEVKSIDLDDGTSVPTIFRKGEPLQ